MKIKGEFDTYSSTPEYIEIAYTDKKNALIKLENLTIDGNYFKDNDAYFLGDLQIPETIYLFTNFDKILDDYENDVFFKSLTAEDDVGKVFIRLEENEENPGERFYSISAEWFETRDKKNTVTQETVSETDRPNLANLKLFSFEELERLSRSLTIEDYIEHDQIHTKEQHIER